MSFKKALNANQKENKMKKKSPSAPLAGFKFSVVKKEDMQFRSSRSPELNSLTEAIKLQVNGLKPFELVKIELDGSKGKHFQVPLQKRLKNSGILIRSTDKGKILWAWKENGTE